MPAKPHECLGLGRCIPCAEHVAREASVDRNRRWAETDFSRLARAMRTALAADQRAQHLECPHEWDGKEEDDFCEPCAELYCELTEKAADLRDKLLRDTEDLFP